MIILAFDPGSNETGFAVVDTRGGGGTPITVTYLDSGNIASKPAEFSRLIRSEKPDIVAVENLAGFAYATKGPGIVAALISSAHAAGLVCAIAWAEGVELVEMTATQWRKIVLGNGSATDERIADVVPKLIHGWPKRSNKHTRDAAGLAVGVSWVRNGKAPTRAFGDFTKTPFDEVKGIAQ